MKAQTGEQLIANAEELIRMGDMDRAKDKSIPLNGIIKELRSKTD